MRRLKFILAFLLIPAVLLAQGIPIKSGSSSNLATVDVNGNMSVNGPTTISQTGFQALAGRNDDGTVTGTPRVNRAYVTEGNRLAVTMPALFWDDTFNAGAQNTGKYKCPITTMTCTFVGGTAIINGGNITTANTNAALQTFKSFPLFAKSEIRVNISGFLTTAPQANDLIEMGLFSAALPGAAAPTDGVFWRYNNSAELRGVINYNGTETQTAAITAPSANVNHDFVIVIQTNTVLFYIDDVLRATISLLTDAPTQGQPMMAATAPLTLRQVIGATPPAAATQLKVSDVFITTLGSYPERNFQTIKAGFGHMAYQGQNGGTMGTTAQYANNVNPAAAVPTNTTAALGTGLGGKFQETLTLAAGTDGIIQSFQNPVGSVTQTPRNLVISGVCVSGVVTVAHTVAAYTSTMSLAFGHTAVSMATAEATSGTKAPRRIALGAFSNLLAAAVGTQVAGSPFCQRFDGGPIVIAPGEFIAITANKVSTAPSAGAIMWSITFDGYFE